MANDKVYANGNIDIWVLPLSGIANIKAPTATEINAGINVSNAVAWDGTTIPSVGESNDVDDRSIKDRGNASSRGFATYEGTLNFFRPQSTTDTSDDFGKAYNFFKNPRFTFYAVVRILQGTENVVTPAVAGQQVSVYKFLADTFVNDLDGENSYKYTVELLSQGAVAANTFVSPAGAITVTPAGSASISVGTHRVLRATMSGHRVTQAVTWTSSDPTKATVSENGVVTGIAAGSASITATHPSGTASTPVAITVTA